MLLKPTDSSMLHAIGYSREGRVLEVVFNTGGVYFYEGVPRRIYQGLLHSTSKGTYMREHIIGKYPYRALHKKTAA